MNLKTKKINRISFGKGKYATPVWSPRGDLIAFTKLLNGEFYIGVMYTDGKGERVVYKSYLVEGPSWSPKWSGDCIFIIRTDYQEENY